MRGDSSSLEKAARAGVKHVTSLGSAVADASAKLLGLGAGAAVAAGAAIASLGRASAANIDGQAKLAAGLGTTTTSVQKLAFQAELSGTSIDVVGKAFKRLQRLQGDAAKGGKEAQDAFKALGINLERLDGLTPDQLFGTVIAVLGSMRDKSERAAAANKVFAESWQGLIPFIEGFEATTKRAADVFDGLSLGVSQEEAASVESLNDALTESQTILVALRDKVFAGFAAPLERVAELYGKWLRDTIEIHGGAEALATTIRERVIGGLRDLAGWLEKQKATLDVVLAVVGAIADGLAFVGDKIGAAAALAGAVGRGEAAGAASAAGDLLGGQSTLDTAKDFAFQGGLGGLLLRKFSEFANDRARGAETEVEQLRTLRDIRDRSLKATFG